MTPTLYAVSILLSVYLIYHDYRVEIQKITGDSICSISEFINCDKVSMSKYAKIGSVYNSSIGLFFFLFAFILSWIGRSPIEMRAAAAHAFLSLVSAVAVFYFIFLVYVQLFLIQGLCIFCLSLYLINLGAFLLLLYGQDWSIKKMIQTNVDLLTGKGLSVVSLLVVALAALFIAVPVTVGIRNFHRSELSKTLAASSAAEPKPSSASEIIPTREETVEKLYKNLAKTNVDLSDSYFLGDKNGPVRIVEFSDFRCPACREKTKFFKKMLKLFPKGVALYFKNFPIDKACLPELGSDGHEHSCLAAKTIHCAGKQGQFWTYHDQVFANQERVSPGYLQGISQNLKLNQKELNDCIEKEGSERVLADIAEAKTLGVNSTPTLFVNDRKIDQIFTIDKFYTLITLLLKQETGRADYPSWEDVEFELLGSLYD